jgi:hypothetical protein
MSIVTSLSTQGDHHEHHHHQHRNPSLQGHRLPQRQVRSGHPKPTSRASGPSSSSTRPTSPSSARPNWATWPTTTLTFKKLGVEIYAVSTDTHFTHKAWHDTSDTIGKIQYPMIGDPTGAITRNFGVMIEEAGLAERGTFVIDPQGQDPDRRDQRRRHRPRRLWNCCARSRPPSTSPATRVKSARPSGRKAKPPWRRRWTWSARSEF